MGNNNYLVGIVILLGVYFFGFKIVWFVASTILTLYYNNRFVLLLITFISFVIIYGFINSLFNLLIVGIYVSFFKKDKLIDSIRLTIQYIDKIILLYGSNTDTNKLYYNIKIIINLWNFGKKLYNQSSLLLLFYVNTIKYIINRYQLNYYCNKLNNAIEYTIKLLLNIISRIPYINKKIILYKNILKINNSINMDKIKKIQELNDLENILKKLD